MSRVPFFLRWMQSLNKDKAPPLTRPSLSALAFADADKPHKCVSTYGSATICDICFKTIEPEPVEPEPVEPEPANTRPPRQYTIVVTAAPLAGHDDDARMVHNLAQHAQALGVVAKEIDPEATVVAYGYDFYKGQENIDITHRARNQDNALAKALITMPKETAWDVVKALLVGNPDMASHPGIIGFLEHRQSKL